MTKNSISRKKIRDVYRKVHTIYYLNSILNKILTDKHDFSYFEITTLSMQINKQTEHLKKQVLDMISLC